MFRLANYSDDEVDRLYKYLSSTASRVIWNGLNIWAGSWPAILDVYLTEFAGEPAGMREVEFFEGISEYLSMDIVRPEIIEGVNRMQYGRTVIGDDGKIGMELIARKIAHMKDKMADPAHYYTFDLFEEYLFAKMLDAYDPELFALDRDGDPYVITSDEEMEESYQKLLKDYRVGEELEAEIGEEGIEKKYANFLAHTIHRLDFMSMWASEEAGFESLFFWDTDYEMVFADGFVPGIRGLAGGTAKIMGYGYESITDIFTDIGIKVPLLLTGSEAAFDTLSDIVQERMAEAMKSLPVPEPGGHFKEIPEGKADEDDLPFS